MRIRDLPAWPFAIAGLILAALGFLLLTGCSDSAAGTARAAAVEAQAHEQAARDAAEKAFVEAARLGTVADTAEAAAKANPSPELIAEAVDARSAAKVAGAVANALKSVEKDAEGKAGAAQLAAAVEVAADEEAARRADAWWLGIGCIALGGLFGGVVGWLTKSPKFGIGVGSILGGVGLILITCSAFAAWLPWLVPVAIVATVAAWAVTHHKLDALKQEADVAGAYVAGEWKRYAGKLETVAADEKAKLDRSSTYAQAVAGIQAPVDALLAKAT